jgi:hypothetical protein
LQVVNYENCHLPSPESQSVSDQQLEEEEEKTQ